MIRKNDISLDAIADPKAYYDSRFQRGYMEGFDYDVYEACRVYTMRKVLRKLRDDDFVPATILDYGCGQGRYIGELKNVFPKARIHGCDISDFGLKIAHEQHPDAVLRSMNSETVGFDNDSFDLVISVEVLEHVQDVKAAVREISRVLKPGGVTVVTTPCANRYSLEWIVNRMRGGLQPSPDGYGRFATDEPGHLRRLNDRHLISLFAEHRVRVEQIYHRAHFFTTLTERLRARSALPARALFWLAMLDWHLFKHLSNGATMLAIAAKNLPG
jgi:SAM-dependent methyltransferase